MATPRPKQRIFLDANILYSAAHTENSGLHVLWQIDDVVLLSSSYAIAEARANLSEDRPGAIASLNRLLDRIELSDAGLGDCLPSSIRLESEDAPILLAAIRGKADYLLTGDKRHFGQFFGKKIDSVEIARPADFLRRYRGRIRNIRK